MERAACAALDELGILPSIDITEQYCSKQDYPPKGKKSVNSNLGELSFLQCKQQTFRECSAKGTVQQLLIFFLGGSGGVWVGVAL